MPRGLDEIPEGGMIERRIAGRSVLLSRRDGRVSCFDNACAHLGMPLEMGDIADGVITCTYHGFRYLAGNRRVPDRARRCSLSCMRRACAVNASPCGWRARRWQLRSVST